MTLLALLSLVLAGDIWILESPDGTVSFTDAPPPGAGYSLFADDLIIPIPDDVDVGRYPRLDDYDALILAASGRHGVSAELIKAVCLAESAMNPEAVSRAGAQGLMQLMPETAGELSVEDPFEPKQAIDGGARYLAQQLERFGSVELALAAYNAGPGNVSRYAGVPPFEETRRYVRRVMALHRHFRYVRPISRPEPEAP